jgi:hypothetical protein
MRTPVIVFSLFVLFFVASVENALACSCVEENRNSSLNQRVREAYKNSAAVFAGKVTNIDRNFHPQVVYVTIQVFDVWKGNIPQTINIITNKGGEACEFPFVLNSDYLIYALADGNLLSTNVCLRTNFFTNNPDVPILNKIIGRKP